ncbi:hypothetical protein JXA34_03450 [Patescibacteria group bacterium]|nr:hypothetical protein [Patescibacteria group bacterium]
MVDLQRDWNFGFVLPNLSFPEVIGNDYVLIAPLHDNRVQLLAKKNASLQRLLNGFTDQFNRSVSPNVLIYNSLSDTNINDALIDFRNIFAIPCIIRAWQDFLIQKQWFTHTPYSEYFDVYPIYPSKDLNSLLILSPAVRGIDLANEFGGQTTPALAGPTYDVKYDSDIFEILQKAWEDRYISCRFSELKTTALFRSLRVAYQACSIPLANYPSIYDIGSSLALWVSAFEIIAHPPNTNVEEEKVLNFISEFPVKISSLLAKRYTIEVKRTKRRCNLPEKLYHQIYDARNNFLHGNIVTTKHLHPWFKTSRHALSSFAPLLYKLILTTYLNIYTKNIALHDLPYENYFSVRSLEEALLKSTKDAEPI